MLIIVRHGQSEANLTHSFAGQWDVNLTELGEKQAKLSAKYVYDNYKIDCIYASDLKRAFNTAKALSDITGLKVIPKKQLREVNAGEWETLLFSELPEKFAEDFFLWQNDIDNCHITKGESVQQLKERVVAEITKLAKENVGKTAYVATHATPIRAIISYVTGEKMQNINWVCNASLTYVDYVDGKLEILNAGCDQHLNELITELPKGV